jgi:phosphoglycolate phosphatase
LKKYLGAIFDLDGTLLDTLADLSDSVNEALSDFGFACHGYDEYKKIVGHGFRDLITKSLPEEAREKNTTCEVLARFVLAYGRNYRKKTVPYAGIPEVLAELAKKGVPLGVNSNKRNDYTGSLVLSNFPSIDFVAVFGEREGVPKKPDPASALEIAKLMGLEPSSVLYIGDSETDMRTGANASMDTAGVLWGFRDECELRSGATYILREAREIAGFF